MMRTGLYPAEKIVDDEIAMDDVVDKGFRELLDPNGGKMKILVSMQSA
jgi:(R,R)-butanediol dehydrogenase/meso-butanediol dehydrogenase/diacetyl reductase